MKNLFLLLFALLALGEGVHVSLGYVRALKGKEPWGFSRFLHWFAAFALLAVWFVWNWYRTFE